MEIILGSHKLFSTQNLQQELVPLIMQEFEEGWEDADNWLLQNCGMVIKFLLERALLHSDYISIIHVFFDVFHIIIHHLKKAFFSENQEIIKLCIRNLCSMIHMYFQNETEVNYDAVLTDLAVNPIYQQTVASSFNDVTIQYLKLQIIDSKFFSCFSQR